jgi:hypothetical protein
MASKCVVLRGEPIVDEQNVAKEALKPGHLIEINAGEWRKHATAGGAAGAIFALERDELGKGIDVEYAIGDRVKAGFFAPGDRVNAILPSGQDGAEGAEVESDGAGRLKVGTTKPVGRLAAASGALTADTRVPVIIV